MTRDACDCRLVPLAAYPPIVLWLTFNIRMTKKQVKSAYDIRRKRRTEKAHPTSRHKLWTSVSYPVYFVYNFISSSLARRPQLEQHQHPITTTNTTTSTTSTIAPTTTGTQHTLSNWDRATRNAAARGLRRRYILSYTKNTARTVFSKRWMRQAVRWDLVGVSLSKCWGTINSRPLPQWARRPIYQMWGRVFKCNMDEVREPLHTYPTLAAFFARQLKDGARPICEQGMASPVDGRVISCGPVDGDLLEQIKGKTYSLSSFLGYKYDDLCNKNSADHPTRLYQCIVSTGIASFMLYSLMLRQIYLSPGDYHRIHFPVACSINKRRHFPGTLFPVNYPFLRMIPSLFALNERVVLMGDWPEGFFSLTAVGAYPIW